MKRFLINGLMFLVIFFVIEKSSCFLLLKAPQKEVDKRLEWTINGEMNKELIVIGSSRGAGNILAGQLEKETGLESYNLSYQGTNIEFHNFILTTLLKFNQSPKTVVLNIDSPHAFFVEKSLDFRTDPLRPLVANNYINDELINRGDNSVLSKLFYLARIDKSNFNFKKKKPKKYNPIDDFGSMPLLKISTENKALVFTDALINYSEIEESQPKIEAFKHIQSLCKAKNIKLVCVFSPSFNAFNSEFLKRFKLLLKPENQLFVYNQEKEIYKDSNYYFDNAHLNFKGASIFTNELSTFIKLNKIN